MRAFRPSDAERVQHLAGEKVIAATTMNIPHPYEDGVAMAWIEAQAGIHAHHFDGNPASGRVLEKIGMRREGCLRRHVLKWGRYEDLVMYGILREEFEPDRRVVSRSPANR